MGDYVRWAPPYHGTDEQQGLGTRSGLYLALNRGKRSIRLDLKTDAGRDALLRLVRDADVVLESFRPGVLDRLGVGYETLKAENPRIIYCAITGYGLTGPNVSRAGHDTNYLALGGLLGLTGAADGPPVQRRGADRRPRRRRPDGDLRHPRRALGARALGRGPARGRLDDRWRAELARDGRRRVLRRRQGAGPRPGDAERRRRLLHPVRVRRRLGLLRRPGAEVLAGVLRRDRPRGPAPAPVREARLRGPRRGRRGVQGARRRPSGPPSTTSTTAASSRCSTWTRRCRRSSPGSARWWSRSTSPSSGPCACSACRSSSRARPGDATRPAPALGEHTREVLEAAGFEVGEIDELIESGAAAGLSAEATGSFMS